MLNISENAFRDYIFNNHKEDFSSLIAGRREPVEWYGEEFPPLHFLLRRKVERAINEILDQLEELVLTAKELRLEKNGPHPTRVDLFGCSDSTGITIIELKKSQQTERQAFTELLAYANHFSSIFAGVNETAITTVLVAPMETRTVKDAYVQELLLNKKNIVSLIPSCEGGRYRLNVFYPDESYYRWFENNVFNDHSMTCLTLSFPLIKGWIDSEYSEPPQYAKDALNQISKSIAQVLESKGFHSIVYASQKWSEITSLFPYPNMIVVAAVNPFSSVRTYVEDDEIGGRSAPGRLTEIQAIYNQLTKDDQRFNWFEAMESNYTGRLIRAVRDQLEFCLLNDSRSIHVEI